MNASDYNDNEALSQPRRTATRRSREEQQPIASRTRSKARLEGRVSVAHDHSDPYLNDLSSFLSVMNSTPIDPPNRRAAMRSEHKEQWKAAEEEELMALHEMETWKLVTLPDGANVVSSKWVYKVKTNSDGSIARYKARLVARGFTQIAGVDYEETFAPTAKFTTIRLMLSLACSLCWPVDQADIDTAFLWAKLEEDIYMQQPPGHEDPDYPHHVCKLQRSLYGLKQSAHLWNQLLSKTLKSFGYEQLLTDTTCFVRKDDLHKTRYCGNGKSTMQIDEDTYHCRYEEGGKMPSILEKHLIPWNTI
jgi:hypothetical protein